MRRRLLASTALAIFAAAAPLHAQQGPAPAPDAANKPTVRVEDYGRFENLGSFTFSPNGQWVAWSIARVDRDVELQWRASRGADSVRAIAYASRPTFSADNRWLAYSIGHSEKERKAAEKSKTTLHSKLAVVRLATGETTVIDDVASFTFDGTGRFLALRGYPAEGQSGAAGLVVRDLDSGLDTHFGNVSAFEWQDDGAMLAMIIEAPNGVGNGVQLFDAASGRLRTLESDTVKYRSLAWSEDGDDLAFLRIVPGGDREGDNHVVIAWRDLARGGARAELDPAQRDGLPNGHRIVEHREPSWSEDGATVFFGIQEWRWKPGKEKVEPADSAAADSTSATADDEEQAGVEVWHAGDVSILPQQKVRANTDRQRNHLFAWHVANDRMVQIGNDLTENADIVDGTRLAFGTDETPYEREAMFGPQYVDLYVIDVATGERTLAVERVQYHNRLSPGGKYIAYYRGGDWFVYDVARRTHTNVTEGVETSFADVEDDHTVPEKPPHGFGGWTAGDRSLLLYDKYDIWEVSPDGRRAERLTDGAASGLRHRLVRIDSDEPSYDLSKPTYLALYGEDTKQYGYGRLTRSGAERLVLSDANVSRIEKAENAEVYGYVVQRFDDSPDLFVGSGRLADAVQLSRTNPFVSQYAWGRAELIEFQNRQGRDLDAALFYPADYQPGRKYPMIVYIYETVSNTLHNWSSPSERSVYNPTVWTQQGYFVLRPDIVYRDRNPGLSAVDALEPAVDAAIATGMIDPERVGLIGHSWGGYQTAFAATVSDRFAAAVAGAPLTELISMYLSIYWNSGSTDARIFEISQGRMEVPPWEDLESYMANSPVFNIQKMQTPLLVAFGTEDGAVDWDQGIVMYNAARRAGKDMVMLVYEGENHSLAKEPNQIDYHNRILEWFGYYLKGDPAPGWITDGVRFLDKDRVPRPGRTVTTTSDGNGH